MSKNELTTLNECECNLPTSIISFDLSSNHLTSVLSPRTLSCLSKLQKINFSQNPLLMKLKTNKIDEIGFILSLLLDCNLKYINGKKLVHSDFKHAKEFYKNKNSVCAHLLLKLFKNSGKCLPEQKIWLKRFNF